VTDESSSAAAPGLPLYRRLAGTPARAWGWLMLFTIVTRLPLLTYPKACDDEQVYNVVAIEMLHGGVPYVDAVERKPPLLFYLYRGILGVAGAHNYFALHVVALLWTLATMALIAGVLRRMFDAATGLVGALLYAIFSAWANYTDLALNGELLMNLPAVAAVALALRPSRSSLRPDLMAAGALVSLAFLLKQPSVITGVPLAVYVLHPDYRRSRGLGWGASLVHAAMLLIGFVGALAVAALYLNHVGILREAWYWTITNHAVPFGPTTWFFWHKLPWRGALFVVETLPLLLLVGVSLRAGWGTGEHGIWARHRSEFAALVVLLAGCCLGVLANGQFNYHYFLQLTPPLALLGAPVLADIWSGARAARARYLAPRLLARWLAVTALLFLVVDAIGLARHRGPLGVAVYARAHSTEDDRIFMWGQATAHVGIYLDAQRRPASRYVLSFPLNGMVFGLFDESYDTTDRIVPGSWDNLRRDFERHPPKFIIDCHAVSDGPLHKIRKHAYMRQLLDTQFEEVFRGDDGIVYARRPVS